MDDVQGDAKGTLAKESVRKYLKVLLLHLAAKSDNPGSELHELLNEVIGELHEEVEKALKGRSAHLRLVAGSNKLDA